MKDTNCKVFGRQLAEYWQGTKNDNGSLGTAHKDLSEDDIEMKRINRSWLR